MLSDDKQAKDVKRIDLIPDGWKKLLVDASVIGGRDPLVGSSNRKCPLGFRRGSLIDGFCKVEVWLRRRQIVGCPRCANSGAASSAR